MPICTIDLQLLHHSALVPTLCSVATPTTVSPPWNSLFSTGRDRSGFTQCASQSQTKRFQIVDSAYRWHFALALPRVHLSRSLLQEERPLQPSHATRYRVTPYSDNFNFHPISISGMRIWQEGKRNETPLFPRSRHMPTTKVLVLTVASRQHPKSCPITHPNSAARVVSAFTVPVRLPRPEVTCYVHYLLFVYTTYTQPIISPWESSDQFRTPRCPIPRCNSALVYPYPSPC